METGVLHSIHAFGMHIRCKVLLVYLILISSTYGLVNITYLVGVWSCPTCRDYYFNCNTEGTVLIWDVNGQGVGGYESYHSTETMLSGSRSNFNYTAMLLSLPQMTPEGTFSFDSVLVVSFLGDVDVDVSCWDGYIKDSLSTNISDNVRRMIAIDVNSSIANETRWCVKQDRASRTRIFICGMKFKIFFWRASRNKSRVEVQFGGVNEVGESNQGFILGETVREQAVLLAYDPYQTVGVFFVTDKSEESMTCNRVSLSRYLKLRSTITQMQPDLTSSTTSGYLPVTTLTSEGVLSSSNGSVIRISVAIPVVCIIIVCVIVVVMFIIIKGKKDGSVECCVVLTAKLNSSHNGDTGDVDDLEESTTRL